MSSEIYSDRYAPHYASLYIDHPSWAPKLRCNVALLNALLDPLGNWLDTCCGQGWHLAQFPRQRRMGIDISSAQLDRAKLHNPGVPFIQADIVDYEFPDGQRFDLVSNFWTAYAYLNDEEAIRTLVQKLVRWTAPGGALYMELAVPERLEGFNDSKFAADTGTRVALQSADGVRWQFHDVGGVHHMITPQLEFFTDIIAPHFAGIDHSTMARAVRQLVARGKLPD